MPIRWAQKKLKTSSYVRRAVEEPIDTSDVWSEARLRVHLGFLLLVFGWITGWPLVAVFGALAFLHGRRDLITVVAPIAYAASWVPYLAGLGLLGSQGFRYRKAIGQSVARFFAVRLVPEWRRMHREERRKRRKDRKGEP
jgi:hypothetical protein